MVALSTRISGSNPVFEDSELVLGLVAPVGTNFERFQHRLDRCVRRFGYETDVVRVSDLIGDFETEPAPEPAGASAEAVRLRRMMHAGNQLRLDSQRGEFLALAVARTICSRRGHPPVLAKRIHVVRSLKHPDEVRALRRIYGTGFYLVGVTLDEAQRRTYLQDDKGCSSEEVEEFLRRDEHEEDPRYIGTDGLNYGQRTQDTFHLSDVFVPLDKESELERFLKLVFACPFETPTQDEYGMFLAFGASLRSGDLSRQVGAVVITAAGDVAAVGANDVPRAGGGLYWPDATDQRDHRRNGGVDSNEERREKILADVLKRLCPADQPEDAWIAAGKRRLKGSLLTEITEYGRAAHAEMEALLSCARSGVSTRGATLYTTTFPCHNCAKHIVAAGIARVVYVEPYPKSQASDLFSDSIALHGVNDGRVRFEQFVGISSRRFVDLFSMSLSSGTNIRRKLPGGQAVRWSAETAAVRVPMMPNSYLDRERAAIDELHTLTTIATTTPEVLT